MSSAQHPQLLAGTRGSPLALWQVGDFLQRIRSVSAARGLAHEFAELVIRTTGDATQAAGTRLADIGGKGLFAKEIHEAMADGRIGFAVHSLKDLETELPAGIILACALPREDPRDALIVPPGAAHENPYDALPHGALVATGALRRQAQLLHARPDLRITGIRGNVQTRLDKLVSGTCDATLLALAGMKRLGLGDKATYRLAPEIMLPAACQGIVGITVRAADTHLVELLAAVADPDATVIATAERAMLAALDGSCRTPIGAFAEISAEGLLHLRGLVARADGSFLLRRAVSGARADAARLGRELGLALRADSPRDLFG